MASKFSYELELNTKGYKDGIKEGKEANADFTSSINKVKNNLPNLRKELGAARKETMGLALAYSKLSDAEKNSGFGQALSRELEESKQRAAELVDMAGDLQTELKNMASDTAAWDAMKEGIGIAKDATTGLIGAVATLSGKEKELQPLIAKIATVQGIANAAIGIGNALQKQSSIMLGIAKIQKMALVKATELEAAATGKATIAQRLFNAVAKANPYVLLASAVIAVGGALVAYALKANKAEDATAKLNKEMHEASIQGQKDAQEDITKVDILYGATQNLNLSMENRKKAAQDLIDQYPAYFQNLSTEQIMLGQASQAYQQLKDDILAVAMAKAYQDKIAEIAKENVELEDQIAKQKEIVKQQQRIAKETSNAVTAQTYGTAQINLSATNASHFADKEREATRELERQEKQLEANKQAQQRYLDQIQETIPAQQRLSETNKPETKTPKATGTSTDDVKAVTGSINDLEKQITYLQNQLKNGLIPDNELQLNLDTLKRLQDQVKELKIKYGFEKPEKAKTKLEELKQKLEDQQKAYIIAVDSNDKDAQQAALKAYYEAQKLLDQYQLSIKIEPQPDPQKIAEQKQKIQEVVDNALNVTVEPKYDFSNLPDFMQDYANNALNQLKRIEDARKNLTNIMNSSDSSDAQISSAQAGLEALDATYQKLIEDVQLFSNANKELEIVQKNNEKIVKSVSKIGNAVQATSNLFSALGEASDDEGMKAAGIVAQAVATIALSFAQAMNSASKNWVTWLAFGVTGLATMITMISQIKNSTGGYAHGGVIPGSSFYGDKLMINANSGERVLTAAQNQNFERLVDMLDHNKINSVGAPANVYVTGKIQGKDLLLVQKNTNKILRKSGQSINI